jgi:hypothetical protein
MDPSDLKEIWKVLRRHEETLLNNEISLKSFSIIIHNIENKLQTQNTKIVDILEEHKKKFTELEVECYLLKCTIQYLCKVPLLEATSQQVSNHQGG